MSKLRSTINLKEFKNASMKKKYPFDQKNNRSFFQRPQLKDSKIFQSIKCQTDNVGGPQQQKDHLYNRNIGHYRQAILSNDSRTLPFLSALRQIKDYRRDQARSLTVVQPFEASLKATINQKTKKDINDITANPFRLSKANYRWQNQTGAAVKIGCEFQCSLRSTKDKGNPQQSSFRNTIRPLRYKTVEARLFDQKELNCQRQRKLFTLIK